MSYPQLHLVRRAAAIAAALLCASAAAAADWPAYRADAARSGYVAETLPKGLSLRWTYRPRHAPRPAWPGRDTRMPFDRAFHVAVVGGSLVYGSSADGAVHALDAATGAERWVFGTGGPVRLAPAVWRSRVFVVSDDGFLYCLAMDDGRLAWKRRGGPVDSMVLGNGRMISRWPARGGPAIADGIVYFAAGIWPSEGIYLYALDAATGEVRWCNDTAGFLYMAQPHGGANSRSGVSAQGPLVVAGDRVLVPTGRAVPAVFDRATGEFLYFHLQRYGRYGGSPIVGAAPHFLHSNAVFDLASGERTCSGIPTEAVAVGPDRVVYAVGKEIVAIGRAEMVTERGAVDRKGKKAVRAALGEPVRRMASPHGDTRLLIAAGSTVVAAGADRVSVLDMDSSTALLSAEVDGAPAGLAAAGGRLFVSTEKGTIHCFAAQAPGAAKTIEAKAAASRGADNPLFAAAADEVVRATGITEGYCLDLACGDGALASALAERTTLQICAIDDDPEKVALARKRLDATGLLGARVTVLLGDPARTPYPNWFANLVVSGRSVTDGPGVVPADEMLRLQRPYGGVTCIGKPGAMTTTVRGAVEGAGTWTHQYCDPANSNCSADTVRGPLGVLWFTDLNFQMPSRHGRGPAPLFHNGRLFVEGMNGLRCVDAYNGRTVWEHPLPGILKAYDAEHIMGASGTGSNFCVTPEAVFVRVGGHCLKLDPATGKLLAELDTPAQTDGEPAVWGYIASVGGTLFGTLSDVGHIVRWVYKRGDMRTQFTESRLLFAMDARTGKRMWCYEPRHSIRNNTIAIGRGQVFLIDRPVALRDLLDQQAAKWRGRPVAEHPTGALVALNAADGHVAWRATDDIYGTVLALSEEHDVLVMAYQPTRFKLASERGGRMAAFRASDGKRLWDIQAKYGSRLVLNGRTIYAEPGAWDLLTGKQEAFRFKRSYGCGTISGSRHLLLFRSATLGYVDLTHGNATENYGAVRPGCWINAIAAGGLVLMPDATDRCTCSYLIKASVALQPYGLRPPAISPERAPSRTPITVRLDHEHKGAEIRYTLDGSPPSAASTRYAGPFRLAKSATIKARAFAPRMPPSQTADASFLIDPAIIPIRGAHWRVLDTPGGRPPESKWQVADGVVTELSNHCKGVASDGDHRTERPGSYRVFASARSFTDCELSLELASTDNDGLGVAFCFEGPDRHYLWAMDEQRRFHILALKDGDTYRILASRKAGYARGRWHKLRVVLDGPKIAVYLDGNKDLEATDATLRKGTFALYAWGCAGAKFRGVLWR